MKLRIPLTGKVTEYHPELEEYGASCGIGGDLNDPVKPVPINLGNVSWKLISIDLETDTAEIEVKPSDRISIPTGKFDAEGNEIYETREATEEEKQGFLNYAKNLVEGHTADELYTMSNSKRLIKSKDIIEKWKGKHKKVLKDAGFDV